MLDYLTHDVSRRREAGETVAVLFIDLDGLKPLNDTYGHEVGDTAIMATAMALVVSTGECDVVGRLGGDEFLVVLCHEHSLDGDTVVERIHQSVRQCRIPVDDMLVPAGGERRCGARRNVTPTPTRCSSCARPTRPCTRRRRRRAVTRDRMLAANNG